VSWVLYCGANASRSNFTHNVPSQSSSAKSHGRGKGSKDEQEEEETFEEREHNRDAAGEKLEDRARLQRLANEQV
jgi:hypothetical protein